MKLIKIAQDHYIIVDDSGIQEGDMIYLLYGNTPSTKQGGIARCEFPDANNLGVLWKKITHSTQPLEWFGGEIIFLSEVKELIGEVDVEKKVRQYYEKDKTLNNPSSFKAGYNQALEDNKEKKWTDDDLRKAIFLYAAWITGGSPSLRIAETAGQRIEQIIKSLQPKTEWEVEFVDGKLALKK